MTRPPGRIEAGWTVDGDAVSYDVTVPAGSSGTLILSAGYHDIKINGAPVSSAAGKETRSPLAPGTHKITFRISGPQG